MEDFTITSSRVSATTNSSLENPTFSQLQPPQHVHRGERRSRRRQHQRRLDIHERLHLSAAVQLVPPNMRDEACSAFLVLLSFWILACTIVIFGFYGTSTTELGPNCSRLIKPNPFFVQSIKVKEIRESVPGSMLFGFTELPPLHVPVIWTEVHDVFIESNDHKEWPFFLNKGSKIRISYDVKRPSSAALSLVIAEGRERLAEWINDPSFAADTALSFNIIHENGTIEQEIRRSATYYIAVKNLNLEEVEIQLNYTIFAITYNTSQAQYNCSLSHSLCTLTLHLFGPNVAVLTSPDPVQFLPDLLQSNETQLSVICAYQEGTCNNNKWYVQLSYGQRWISYLVGSVSTSVLVLVLLQILSVYQLSRGRGAVFDDDGRTSRATERTPLLASDDDADLDSSSDSTSHEEDEEDTEKLDNKKQLNKEEENERRLCVICMDALRNCFFLPCGHCAACFTCATRVIEEEARDCPTCHKAVNKVSKIYTV